MTTSRTLDLFPTSPTRRQLRRMLVRTVLASLALTAALFAAVPVSVTGGAVGFSLFSVFSAAAVGLLLKGRRPAHSLCQFLGCIVLCAAEVLALWDLSPATNLLLFGAAQSGDVLYAVFLNLLYCVIAFFTMLLTLALRTYAPRAACDSPTLSS